MKLNHEALSAMIRYNAPDLRRIAHAQKVASWADLIAEEEGCDERTRTIIHLAAVFHDIGIHEAERKHHSSAGNFQELEGPGVASPLLDSLGVLPDIRDRVLFLIAHHHTYTASASIDFQILIEADFLVNAHEDNLPAEAVAGIRSCIFKTSAGTTWLNRLFP